MPREYCGGRSIEKHSSRGMVSACYCPADLASGAGAGSMREPGVRCHLDRRVAHSRTRHTAGQVSCPGHCQVLMYIADVRFGSCSVAPTTSCLLSSACDDSKVYRALTGQMRAATPEAQNEAAHRDTCLMSATVSRTRWRLCCRPPAPTAESLVQHAVELQSQLDLAGALASLEAARQLDPTNASVLTLASKQWTDHTYLRKMRPAEVQQCNEKAIALAKRAQAADARLSLAHAAECICKGRLAEVEPSWKAKLTLAKEAQEAAYRAIELDANDDLAHHLIGRWHFGMANLNYFAKVLIKHVFGTEFRPGTLEGARASYEAAIALRPDRIIHKVALAQCLASLGCKAEAIALVQVRTTRLAGNVENAHPSAEVSLERHCCVLALMMQGPGHVRL
jgi:hypothetical protein